MHYIFSLILCWQQKASVAGKKPAPAIFKGFSREIPGGSSLSCGKGKGRCMYGQVGANSWLQGRQPVEDTSHASGSRTTVTCPAHSTDAFWQFANCTAQWKRHSGVNNLPGVITHQHLDQDLNPWPLGCKSNAQPVAPLCHLTLLVNQKPTRSSSKNSH